MELEKLLKLMLLKKWLEDSGIEVEAIVEPTDSAIGKLIREMLREPNATKENIQKNSWFVVCS